MRRALADRERGYGTLQVQADDEALRHIARIANGDTRAALGAIELAVLTTAADENGVIHIDLAVAEESIQKPVMRCDESLYYDMLSAFCKSLRGSDSDAALAWFARLIYGGGSPVIVRAVHRPRTRTGLGQSHRQLQARRSPGSGGGYAEPGCHRPAIIAVCESPSPTACPPQWTPPWRTRRRPLGPVPVHLRDTHYSGHSAAAAARYKYPHDSPATGEAGSTCPGGSGQRYYRPSEMGHEATILKEQFR